MDDNKMMPKQKTLKDYIPWIIALIFIILFGMWAGYVVDCESGKKGADFEKAYLHYDRYLNISSVFKSIGKAIATDSYARKGFLYIGGVGFAVIAYFATKPTKRDHRKGIEHGSARWGNKKEKTIIQDPYDFYNNIICSSDVFLVLDRKKREQHEQEANGNKRPKKAIKKPKKVNTEKEKTEVNNQEYLEYAITEDIDMTGNGSNDAKLSLSKLTGKNSKNTDKSKKPFSVADAAKLHKKAQKIKPMLNLNMIILGGSGTGKSRFFVKPNLMQLNTSYVVTDPSGELLQSCGKMLERNGYKIKVFNVDDMAHSSNYNPFHYLRDLNNEKYKMKANGEYELDINGNKIPISDDSFDENSVIKMINVFMMNTKQEGAQSGDQFWDDATRLLLSAICFLILEICPIEQQNFATVLDIIHTAQIDDSETGKKQASVFDGIFENRREQDSKALSVQYYDEFKQAAGKTMQSILISTTTKLQHFKLEKLRDLTYTDNIHLEELGDEKQILFIIIPSTDTTYNFLAAMMYTQLFDTLYNRAIKKYHGRLKVPVQFILDEFANVGKIPEFDKVLATCRKFQISAVVILQNLSQLKRLYEKSWEELPGNCDTMIFLGGKDQFTNEYLMKSLGKETIDLTSINKTKSQQGSTSFNESILGRELMSINELETMDNSKCIVMVRGLPPFFTDKFDIVNHEHYSQLDEGVSDDSNTFYINKNIFVDREPEQVEGISDDILIDEAIDADIMFEIYDSGDSSPITGENLASVLGFTMEEYEKSQQYKISSYVA